MPSSRFAPVLVLLAASVAGCNTTASRELVLAVNNYDARSREAIASIETIEAKAIEQPPVSASQAEQDFATAMLDPAIDFDGFDHDGDPATEDMTARQIVESGVHMFDLPADLPRNRALDEMRCAHGRFTDAFDDVESAGVLGKSTVSAEAPPILARLIAQQLVMARLVSGPLHADMVGLKAALIAEVERIRASNDTEEEKRAALIALRGRWVAIESEETQLTEAAVEDLLKAAATGIALRQQMLQYGKWSFADLVDSANGLSSFMATVSGRDLGELNGAIARITSEIAGDPDLKASVDALLASIDPPLPHALQPPSTDEPDTGAPAVTFAMPCLTQNAAAGGS